MGGGGVNVPRRRGACWGALGVGDLIERWGGLNVPRRRGACWGSLGVGDLIERWVFFFFFFYIPRRRGACWGIPGCRRSYREMGGGGKRT